MVLLLLCPTIKLFSSHDAHPHPLKLVNVEGNVPGTCQQSLDSLKPWCALATVSEPVSCMCVSGSIHFQKAQPLPLTSGQLPTPSFSHGNISTTDAVSAFNCDLPSIVHPSHVIWDTNTMQAFLLLAHCPLLHTANLVLCSHRVTINSEPVMLYGSYAYGCHFALTSMHVCLSVCLSVDVDAFCV